MASYGSIDKIGRQLLDLKSKIEQKKSKRSEVQGELNSIKKQMKADFSTDVVEEIRGQIEENEKRILNLEASLTKRVAALQGLLDKMNSIITEEDEEDEE